MFLSFVIPCYNVGNYIERCLDSIFLSEVPESQFEVICVNDCSTDDTFQKLSGYARLHGNLRVVPLDSNRGWGGARTAGLLNASGDYVWYVDADDKIVSKFFSDLVMTEYNVDVLCFNYRDVFSDGVREYPLFTDVHSPLDGNSFIKMAFKNRIADYIGYVWRFIYRRQFLLDNGLLFPEHVCWEDTLYMPKSLMLARSVLSTSSIGYEYFHNESSVCSSFGRKYPGKLVYELVFCAGRDLLQLSEQAEDSEVAMQLRNCAVNDYFNQLPVYLCRQNCSERKAFYSMAIENRAKDKYITTHMRLLPKAMLLPIVGPMISLSASLIYKLTHR